MLGLRSQARGHKREGPTVYIVLGKALFHEDAVKEGGSGIVLVRDIDFSSTAETSLLPFHGRCHIAYVPTNGVVLGLSKFARLTKQCAKKLTSQQCLGREVAVLLQQHLSAAGALQMSYKEPQPQQQLAQQVTTASVVGCFGDQHSSHMQELIQS
eukprot:gene9124-16247_t